VDNYSFISTEDYREEIEDFFPKFVFYRRGYHTPTCGSFGEFIDGEKGKVTDCYCTACHERYEDGSRKPSEYKHKELGYCTNCGHPVEFRQMNRGRQSYYVTGNFAIFEGAGDLMRIKCIKAYQRFSSDTSEMEPEIGWYTVTQYELRPGQAIQYKAVWNKGKYEWKRKKTGCTEPNFNIGGFGYADRNYTLINQEAVDHSFLKYLFKGEHYDYIYITWLCCYAQHPQLEYLLHGGFEYLARNYVEARVPEYGKFVTMRYNWRSNDLKKMLRLDRQEIKFLAKEQGRYYDSYIKFRRDFFKGRNTAETLKYFENFHSSTKYIREVEDMTGIARKKIMDYALRKQNSQGTYFFITLYKDYIEQCIELERDMSTDVVTMPKDMFAAHDRTTEMLRTIRSEKVKVQLAESDAHRRDLEVTDMELGLILRLPYDTEEIVAEGEKLSHCVGGYADRHAAGKLAILFLRTVGHPGTPYYTMEVSNDLQIVQCRGYRNNSAGNPKTEEIIEFERRYEEYLNKVKIDRKKAAEKAKRKKRQQQKAKAAA
jgi:hypothetical protein